MKTSLAVITACAFMVAGWVIMSSLLFVVMQVASGAVRGLTLMYIVNLLLIWIISPGFGGFMATFVTQRIFRNVSPARITIGFLSVISTIFVFASISIAFVQTEPNRIFNFIILLFQAAAIFAGAKFGEMNSRSQISSA
jgi:hypothetical protein